MIKKVNSGLSKKEKQQLVLEMAALTTEVRAPFMEIHGLPKTLSDRKKVKERIEKAIKAETISYAEIIGFLDEVVPWGKQHVYLFKGPSDTIQDWKKPAWLKKHLKANAAELIALVNNKIHVGLPKPILNLCALELADNGITRAHGFEIQSLQSRSIVAKSGASSVSVFGEASVDDVYKSMSKNGVGNLGNFYWLPRSGSSIKDELRVVLVGSQNRVNFTAPSNEKVVRRVLTDILRNV